MVAQEKEQQELQELRNRQQEGCLQSYRRASLRCRHALESSLPAGMDAVLQLQSTSGLSKMRLPNQARSHGDASS